MHDSEFLQAALIGLQHALERVDAQIAELRGRLGGKSTGIAAPPPAGGRRPMSAAARRRIALAQKKRWAAYKADHGKSPAAKAPVAKAKPQKRALSAEGRAHIIEATRKRWAAFHKSQQAPAKKAAKKAPAAKAVKKAPPAKPLEAAPEAVAAAAPAAE